MKKLIIGLGLLISSLATAQSSSDPIVIGVKGGLNMATLSGVSNANTSSRTGFVMGIYGKVPLNGGIIFQPEILLSQQGSSVTTNGIVPGIWSKMFGNGQTTLTYLNIPMMFKFYLREGFFVEAGPQLSLLVGKSVSGGLFSSIFGDIANINNPTERLKTTDYAINFGLGFQVKDFEVGGRYSLGLGNIADSNQNNGNAISNNVLQFFVAYDILK